MKKRKITSEGQPLLAPNGRILSNVRISFTLVDANSNPIDVFDADTGERIAGIAETLTDANGEFEIELFPNQYGDKASYYYVHVNSNSYADFKATLVDGVGDISFYDFKLMGAEATPAEISSIQAYLDSFIGDIIDDTATTADKTWSSQKLVQVFNQTVVGPEGETIEYVKSQQSILYAQFYRDLKKGTAVQICCMGDSMTYGQDTTSGDKRAADSTPTSDGTAHTQTRAGVTYPEALQTYLTTVYGSGKVTVINRGYSGDWIDAGLEHWNVTHSSNLTIAMYGTNDSRAAWVPADIRGDVSKYIQSYEQLIIREILWGKAVIILMPPKLRTASDADIESFANALIELGQRYNVPVVDAELFVANYPSTIYSDSVHFATAGYQVFASKVAALLIGQGANNAKIITSGSKLLTRPNIDNIKYIGGTGFVTNVSGAFTPNEADPAGGIAASWTTASGKGIVYSFYTEEEDLVVLPWYYSANKNLRLTLDFNTASPRNTIDAAVRASTGLSETIIKQITYDSTNANTTVPSLNNWIIRSGGTQTDLIRISEKGWHTLLVESTIDGQIYFNGLWFIGFQEFYAERQAKEFSYLLSKFSNNSTPVTKSMLVYLTHEQYDTGGDVSTSTFTIEELKAIYENLDGAQYYRNPVFSIVVNNYNQSVLRYAFTIPAYDNSPYAGFSWWLVDRHDIASPVIVERTISNITFDGDTDTFTITWTAVGSGLSRSTEFTIKQY